MLKACACAGEQGSRGAGEQGSRGAREQGRVQCALFFPLCPSAPLALCPSAFQTCEKCGLNPFSFCLQRSWLLPDSNNKYSHRPTSYEYTFKASQWF
ncbi:MAG: hypothetical protein V7L23_00155 [Nostoc sp.]|uniref:hypothetical protein n=1 Tax=Nostoc sp. TaxID=1180 RepID=UPI002FEF48E7